MNVSFESDSGVKTNEASFLYDITSSMMYLTEKVVLLRSYLNLSAASRGALHNIEEDAEDGVDGSEVTYFKQLFLQAAFLLTRPIILPYQTKIFWSKIFVRQKLRHSYECSSILSDFFLNFVSISWRKKFGRFISVTFV